MKEVNIYTDGSCLGNPGPGGWAALLRFGEIEKELSGGEKETTNNRMELTAVIEALKALNEPCVIHLYIDSQYVMNAFEKGWLENWKKLGWRTSSKKPVKNVELWKELDEQVLDHEIHWHWVKGHSGHPENERVDDLARLEAEKVAYS